MRYPAAPMVLRRLAAAVFFASLSVVACADDDPAPTDVGAGTDDVKKATCTATFDSLQKDAYKDTAGRSSKLWPPHTTTTLAVTCNGAEVSSAFQANHGTEPGQKDANGEVFLVTMKSAKVTGTKTALTALAQAYGACSCDGEGGTQFLSLDSIKDEATQGLIGKLASYAEANLTCTGSTTAKGLADLLRAGKLTEFLGGLEGCSFPAGGDFSKGFDEATTLLIAEAKAALADYHVCNNDAALQAQLVETFQTTGKVVACDPKSDLCKGPRWFYNP